MKLLTFFLLISLSLDFLHPAISAERVENHIEVITASYISELKKFNTAILSGKSFAKQFNFYHYQPEVLLPKFSNTRIYLMNRSFLI